MDGKAALTRAKTTKSEYLVSMFLQKLQKPETEGKHAASRRRLVAQVAQLSADTQLPWQDSMNARLTAIIEGHLRESNDSASKGKVASGKKRRVEGADPADENGEEVEQQAKKRKAD